MDRHARHPYPFLALGLAALLAGCMLDTGEVLKQAPLSLRVTGIPPEASSLTVKVSPESGEPRTKTAATGGQQELLLYFEKGSVPEGKAKVEARAVSASGADVGCGVGLATLGPDGSDAVALAPPTDEDNCGACGKSCNAPFATAACVAGACGPLVCQPGHKNVDGIAANGCEASCGATSAEDSPAACSDGLDNNCDGLTDCQQPSCNSIRQACTVGLCPGFKSWDCASRSYGACQKDTHAENTPALCSDGLDNDCDGLPDCLDPDCLAITQACGSCGIQAWVCLAGGLGHFDLCLPAQSAPESNDQACSDGRDNNCNGLIDCQDPGCSGRRCAQGKICCASGQCQPSCP